MCQKLSKINRKFCIVEDAGELVAGEVAVLVVGQLLFDVHHAVKVAEEVGTLDGRRVDALILQFMQETAVAIIDEIADAAKVADVVVGGAAVNVVDGHTGRDGFFAPCDIDGMGDEDLFAGIPWMSKLKIALLAIRIKFDLTVLTCSTRRITQLFASVRIDADADDSAVSVVDIEGYAGVGVHVLSVVGHEFDTDVVEKKRF